MAKPEGATRVVCGHSHVPFIGADRGITMLNPGSVGPRRFMLPIVCIQQVSGATGDGVAQRLLKAALQAIT
jgi:predicted phosphodiesterase